jgi:hypothetical protein
VIKKNQLIRRVLIVVLLGFLGVESLSQTSRLPAEIKFREMHFGKPPLVNLFFDVVLRNDRNAPRWFLLPSNLGSGAASIGDKGGIDMLEVFAPPGKGRVIIGRFLGTGGFQALLLPAHAEVRLQMFPISYWGDVPDCLQVHLVLAKGLIIGREPARKWFGIDPMSSVKADIAETALNPMRILRTRRTPDGREVGIWIEEESRFRLPVSLKASK